MDVEDDDIAQRYALMAEPELQAVARDYDSLTEAAQAVPRNEFARRGFAAPLVEEPDGEPASRTLVTLRRYRDLSEAIVARSLLESAGIVVYLYDENLVRLDWQISNFIGGIRLQVEEADAAAANDLLDQPVPDPIPFEGADDFTQPNCPRCGSIDIVFEGASRAAALTSLYFLALPMPPGRETWLCNACGARWENSEDV
jgi:hypothetical protein